MGIVPYKFTAAKQQEYLDLLATGARRGAAAKAVGITRQMVNHHFQSNEDFAKAVDIAELSANEIVEDAMFRTAVDGNVTAQQVWLYNRDPDHWTDRRGRTDGAPNGNAQHYHQHVHLDSPNEARSEIAGLIAALRIRAGKEAAGNGNGHNGHARGNGRTESS
jgi:hypothetical protein